MSRFRRPTSILPDIYYAIFGCYEPLVGVISTLGAFANPKLAHDNQGPWPDGVPPEGPLPKPTELVLYQLTHVCFLISLLNFFLLREARLLPGPPPPPPPDTPTTHLSLAAPPSPPPPPLMSLQERVLQAYLGTLLFGDVSHLAVSLWAFGAGRWDPRRWTPLLWAVVLVGTSLLVPRLCWVLGVGRYVHARDAASAPRLWHRSQKRDDLDVKVVNGMCGMCTCVSGRSQS